MHGDESQLQSGTGKLELRLQSLHTIFTDTAGRHLSMHRDVQLIRGSCSYIERESHGVASWGGSVQRTCPSLRAG